MKTNLVSSIEQDTAPARDSSLIALTAFLGSGEISSALRNVLESLLEGVGCCDKEGRIIYTNSSFEKIVGLSQEEMYGKKTYELFLTPGTEKFRLAREKQEARYADRQKGISEEYELEVSNPNGTQKWLEVRASPLKDHTGNVVGSVAILNDCTEKKSLQTQLLWSQKMDAVGRLARNVAHDFNNLLTVILGHSEWLVKKLEPESPDQRRVKAIYDASRSAATLTQQLLTVSKRKVVDLKPIDINSIIRDTQAILRDFATEGISIELNLEKRLPFVLGDSGQIQQILINFAINSRDAMPEGGTLTFSTSILELPLQSNPNKTGKYVSISIRDTGHGISEEALQHLFEPFFTTKKNGTGLGLSISHTIVEQHNGRICVSSQLGEGTTFTVLFPESEIIPITSSADETESKFHFDNTKLSILLVEDEQYVREMIAEMLQESGFHIISAENGEEALSILNSRAEEFNLVLSDIAMPKISGILLAETIQKDFPTLPIVLMSGCTIDAGLPHQISSSGIPFIAKPFSFEVLLSTIYGILRAESRAH